MMISSALVVISDTANDSIMLNAGASPGQVTFLTGPPAAYHVGVVVAPAWPGSR
jgi:hypothetical protein